MRQRSYSRQLLRWTLLAVLPVLTSSARLPAAERSSSFLAAMESITAAESKAHVDYLADDALEGREPATRGGRAAGKYLADRLAQCGLRGAGHDGGYFQPFQAGYRNILAMLPGSDPGLRHEVIVIGAHYDHVGYGNSRNSRGPIGFIHNGADDNASGTSALLEVAQALTLLPEAPKRTVLIAFWDAEEKGLWGSKFWLAHPTVPREEVKIMLCMDMVGRLRDDHLLVYGSRCGYGLRRLVSSQNDGLGLRLDFDWDLKAKSDHFAFFQEKYPVLLLHTGLHDDYHRPGDDADKIDAAGISRTARLMFGVAYELANSTKVTGYRRAGGYESAKTLEEIQARQPELPSRLGVAWEADESDDPGVRVTAITAGSPAAKAGLQPGDVVLELAGRQLRTGDDLCGAVMAAENPVKLVVRREGQEKPLDLTARLDGEPMRLGITWRVDDAAPGSVILSYVVPGSPAALAGLKPGDHVYQVAGHDFADDEKFLELVGQQPGDIELLVERDGRLRTVLLRFNAQPVRRAA